MQFNLILAGGSVVVLAIIVIRFFYQRYLKHRNQSLIMLSKRPDWVESSINTQYEELLEENIAEEIISSILPPAKHSARTLRETPINDDYELLTLYIMAATPNRPFQGYELLQAISVNEFSYGKMRIFHRHEQKDNLDSPVLFSLVNAFEPGFFNLSEMGSFSCDGLILFMRLSHASKDLVEQFYLMLDIAYQLADDLGGEVLDAEKNPFDAVSEKHYLTRLGATPVVIPSTSEV